MDDPGQFLLLHEIMELKEEMGGWLDLTDAMVVAAALVVVVFTVVEVYYRHDPWMKDYMVPLSLIVSIGVGIAIVLPAWVNQYYMGEYDLMCETYRALYGPLPWEVA